ncbi:hypothetical protein ZIOFF_059848 [Zingiber officinale]|uniref:Uncharacterized protein n=1 Tax=Zingiber officinale TaxID=94328 RepID=A0A8J5F7W2_ZINOF|nr:hypothetical protein ZIOFF_059848 [Zingiber officinale]
MRGNCVEVNQEDDNYPSYAHGISSNGEDSFNHIANHAVDGSEKQKGKSKLKRRLISLSGNLNTEPILDKPNGNGVSQMYLRDAHGERSMTCRDPGSHVNLNHSTDTGVRTLNPAENENLKDFLHLKIVDFSTSETETIEDIVCCDCIFQLGMVVEEREVAILRTCERKIYVIFIDTTPNDQEVITKVVGCHKLEDMREILVGLGLQALRIYLEGKISYLFLTRSSIKLENLLSLLQISESAASYSIWSLKSWENVQVKMLEKYVCGIPKLGLFLYSMLLFWNDNSGGIYSSSAASILFEFGMCLKWKSFWFGLETIFTEWHVQDMAKQCVLAQKSIQNQADWQFGTFVADSGTSSPYYSLHSGCTIRDILEMVIELSPVRCVTLTFADVLPATNFFSNKIKKERQLAETPNLHTWKLKWYSDDALLKFVALVKAIYLGLKSSPLPVKCIS